MNNRVFSLNAYDIFFPVAVDKDKSVMSKAARRTTIMLLSVTTMFILLIAPLMIFYNFIEGRDDLMSVRKQE